MLRIIHSEETKIPKLLMRLIQYHYSLKSFIKLSLPGMRFMANLNFPESTIIFFNVENAVAFTIDDGFCGADNPNGDMTKEIRTI